MYVSKKVLGGALFALGAVLGFLWIPFIHLLIAGGMLFVGQKLVVSGRRGDPELLHRREKALL